MERRAKLPYQDWEARERALCGTQHQAASTRSCGTQPVIVIFSGRQPLCHSTTYIAEATDVRTGNKVSSMRWNRRELAQLKQLWSEGQSAAQIAGHLECSRNAVCGRPTRLGLTRGHKPPTAQNPRLDRCPSGGPTLMAARRDRVRKKLLQ
ncbi:GcrA family cell cycle regulator [Bradyrhizobium sp. WSM1253]|uniref:GcrA family cell cycle regulator n=2 Tax=Bradyrhizobium TaxID=374 RepID=UPI0035294EBF